MTTVEGIVNLSSIFKVVNHAAIDLQSQSALVERVAPISQYLSNYN